MITLVARQRLPTTPGTSLMRRMSGRRALRRLGTGGGEQNIRRRQIAFKIHPLAQRTAIAFKIHPLAHCRPKHRPLAGSPHRLSALWLSLPRLLRPTCRKPPPARLLESSSISSHLRRLQQVLHMPQIQTATVISPRGGEHGREIKDLLFSFIA